MKTFNYYATIVFALASIAYSVAFAYASLFATDDDATRAVARAAFYGFATLLFSRSRA